jgi:hypothetical protein
MHTLFALPRRCLGIALLLVVVAAASVVLLAGGPAAQAHGTSQSPPSGGGHGGVTDSHYFAYACDTSQDGRSVTTYYLYGPGYPDSVTDPSSSGGCVEARAPLRIITYRVCRAGWGVIPPSCSGWRAP